MKNYSQRATRLAARFRKAMGFPPFKEPTAEQGMAFLKTHPLAMAWFRSGLVVVEAKLLDLNMLAKALNVTPKVLEDAQGRCWSRETPVTESDFLAHLVLSQPSFGPDKAWGWYSDAVTRHFLSMMELDGHRQTEQAKMEATHGPTS